MPLNTAADNSPTNFPNPDFLTLGNFKRGVITLIDASRLPKNALAKFKNGWLVEDGQPALRPGVDWFGSDIGAEIDGYDYFDAGGVIHLVAVANGTVYRSLNDGATWTACTGGSFTVGKEVHTNQYNNYLYLTTGDSSDNILLYDGTTTLKSYTALTAPSAPTAVVASGLTGTNYTYFFKISAVSLIGFSEASAKVSVNTKDPRDAWTSTNTVTLTLPALQTGQTRTDIYLSEDDLNYFYLSSVTNTTFVDNGTAVVVPSTTAPTDNTTTGPKVGELTNVGSRMYGVRDPNHRYRIWFTSGAAPYGAFASGYDGGYLDWQPGGKYMPVHVEDYRDGKGTPLATVWCDSADGQGCIIQMSLNVLTVSGISVTIPAAYRLPGSRGTPAPGSVVNVLNDFVFYNTQAFYNLGSRLQLQNLLSTDEMSANIRKTVKTISHGADKGIASVYFDAKIYQSVPYNSSTNNYTAIYDTELKAWVPEAFDMGFKKFLRYTDTTGSQHLLAVKPGDSRLSEISEGISGDYGQPFETDLLTGLYPIMKDRFDFQYTEEMEWEFSNPQGNIFVELLGTEHTKGFTSIKLVPVNLSSTIVNTGWDIFSWDTHNWDDVSIVPETFSESSLKRFANVQAELNVVQWHIYTNSIDARYVLRTLQSWGTPSNDAHPSHWRVKAI